MLELALETKKTASIELLLSLESNDKVDFREIEKADVCDYLPELFIRSVSKDC